MDFATETIHVRRDKAGNGRWVVINSAAREALLSVKREQKAFASRLVLAGVDLYTVQRAGGWKTQTMVQRYAHLSPDHMRAAVKRLASLDTTGATGTVPGAWQSRSAPSA